jgi:hypothetical protein
LRGLSARSSKGRTAETAPDGGGGMGLEPGATDGSGFKTGAEGGFGGGGGGDPGTAVRIEAVPNGTDWDKTGGGVGGAD